MICYIIPIKKLGFMEDKNYMETNILMESGTNELEVLEFIVGGNFHYGINVAKIKRDSSI